MLEVRLSDPPMGNMTVTIDNAAGIGLFGFDVCTLNFTPDNWYEWLIIIVRYIILDSCLFESN